MPKAEGTIEITPLGWDELSKALGDRDLVRSALNKGLLDSAKILKPELKDQTPVGATSNLRNKTFDQVLGRDEDMRLEIRQSAFRDQFPYGAAVRAGARPHFPPSGALVEWVKAKLSIGNETPEKVAFLVARSMAKKGMKANPYHEKTMDAKGAEVEKVMEDAVAWTIEQKVVT